MVYDSHRGKFYMFGGVTEDGVSGKTWEWGGEEWILVSESGPGPRWGAGMVFDSIRNVTVLFGGGGSGGARLNDTWEWDGTQWTQVNVTGPAGRRGHMMAFDSRRGEIVVYGGYFERDTWIYYNGRWRYVTGRGPGNRRNAAMVYDPARDNFVLYGGAYDNFKGTDILAETWILDAHGWQRVADTSPGPLAFQAMTFDTDRGVALMHGGAYYDNDGALHNKLWQWDGSRWSLLSDDGPTPRRGHSMSYDSASHQALLFGGWDNQPGLRGDTWTYGFNVAPTLALDTSCPQSGPAVLTWSCASPQGSVALGHSLGTGYFRIPNGQPCAGTLISLDPDSASLLGVVRSNAQGGGSVAGQLNASACDGYVQLIDAQTCFTSNVLRIE